MPYGFSESRWAAARTNLMQRLIAAAERGGSSRLGTTYYQFVLENDIEPELRPDILANPNLEPLRYHEDLRFDEMIYEVLVRAHHAYGVLLTVVLVHKTGDQRPGNGFYEGCERLLGIEIEDRDVFWLDALRAVYAKFQRQ